MSNDLTMIIDGIKVSSGTAWAHYSDNPTENGRDFSLSIPVELVSPAIDGGELSALLPLLEQADHLLNDVFRITRDENDIIQWVCTSAKVESIDDGKVNIRGTCEPFINED